MAMPSYASPPAARILARVKAMFAERSDSRLAQLIAGKVFLVRGGSALLALLTQVLFARWMGAHEFGIYIYCWTWVLMIGALSDMGLSTAARRFIPLYTAEKSLDRLRGFLSGARWLAFGLATAIAAVAALVLLTFKSDLDGFAVTPLFLATAIIPIYGVVQVQAGIAQSYDWPQLALLPFFVVRQIVLTVLMGGAYALGAATDAVTAMLIAIVATWAVTIGQMLMLNRRLHDTVADGPKHYAVKSWLATSLPIFVVEGFYLLLTYVDIVALEHFGSPDDVAVYFAGARLLAIVAFVYFAVASATTHKFSEYHVAGDGKKLATFFAAAVRWTFWPSLAVCAAILVAGRPLLALFGSGFERGYGVMFILAIGMLARAAVGPAERLLNMLGARTSCALIYALAFAINLALCIVLIPRLGIEGAGAATSAALVVESLLLYAVARRRLAPLP